MSNFEKKLYINRGGFLKIKRLDDILKKYLFILFCILTLALPDICLKGLIAPGFFGEGNVKVVSTFFTVGWILLIIGFCVYILPKKMGKIVFSVIAVIFMIYSLSQYIYFKIFDQFFWLKSIMLAGEGADYLDHVVKMIDLRLIVFSALEILFLVLALIQWKNQKVEKKVKQRFIIIPFLILAITHICMQPWPFGDAQNQWDIWKNPKMVYKNFNDINKSLEITGAYQFVCRDIFTTVFPDNDYDEKDFERVDNFFEAKGDPEKNEYTGLLEGKNVIAVMMESMDTWLINEKYTPTLYKMMNDGINFTNYNAPFFGAGFTFGSEFAFNTGFFTPVSAISASNFSTNSFPYALARLFVEAGYTANSFHFNDSEFYNRGIMHKSFGYAKYNSAEDFGIIGTEAELDTNMIKCDELYKKMTENTPFFDFFVTYSAHLPYTGDSKKLALAKEYYHELISEEENEELNNIHILAHDTDEFFRILLERLEEDGLLDDTVIIAYTDHFAYGVSDEELLSLWKGDDLSYRVPAFIYAKDLKPTEVDKPMMTIDWAPTIVNLFGFDPVRKYIGNDILAPDNDGFAYFETWGWLDDAMYYVPSREEIYTEDVAYIEEKNMRVKESIEVNDTIVLGDYYSRD